MEHKRLPHIDISDHCQFVTFRTHDSVDGFLKKLMLETGANSKKQLAIDEYLDHSAMGAYLNGKVLLELYDCLMSPAAEVYELLAFCIMPNHVHLLINPKVGLPIAVQRIKGKTARLINRRMNREGRFWAADYFDRLIRDERHFRLVYEYIKNNPLMLGEVEDAPKRFYGVYD